MLHEESNSPVNESNIFLGGGEMGALMRAYNWNDHPLGNPEGWPESLKSCIRLMLNSGFPMFIWWSDKFYMFHNDAYLPALGKKHPAALGARARDMWAEIWEQLGVVAEGILENARQFYADSLLIQLDRKGFIEETYWTFSYSPAFNDAGEVQGVFCACFEVTNTVLAQRRQRTIKDISEAMNQVLTLEQACQLTCEFLNVDNRDIPFSLIYLLDGKGTMARLWGKSGGLSAEGAPLFIDITDEKAVWPLAKVKEEKRVLIMHGLPAAGVLHSAAEDDELPEQAVIYPVFKPAQDNVIGFFIAGISPKLEYDSNYQGFHALLTGQIATSVASVQAREQIVQQQRYLNDIFQQAPVAIAILKGPEYIIDLANPGICELWGRRPKDVLGKPVLEALPEIRDQGIKELLDSVYNTGEPYVANELPVKLMRSGQLENNYFNLVYHPLRNAQDGIAGVIVVAVSINEQVEARYETEEVNKQLLATNADLDNFVYSASHDLKAPISNIEGLMNALRMQLPPEVLESPTVKQLLDYIKASIDRFKRTVTELTKVARIQRESGEDVQYVNLAEVVAEVQLDLESAIIESGAALELEFPKDSYVRFSAKNVRSVVYNLLSNAIKYRAARRTPFIRIATENTPEYIILSVSDNGLGIDLAQEHKMFSMFKRLHDHVEGSGVGLYIVKKVVENAGGKIEVESEVGVGSTFRVFFKRYAS
ncbi:ATP-binding protein [Cesiribacter sp. SM1]|uniref:ATP-binding protein n=1 Tax=Cesiribacter sp. SM1 TaxID=2861196 RepID=UPI001CD458D6|nr:ATP-binding protein [Cesiribacter sp. SM1]